MFLDILEPLLARRTVLDGNDIANLKCLCRGSNSAIDWTHIYNTYEPLSVVPPLVQPNTVEKGPCDRCDRRTNVLLDSRKDVYRCLKCQGVIPSGLAKRRYRLATDDLQGLPKFRVQFGHEGVSTPSVVGIALLKHGGPVRLRKIMLSKSERSKAYRERSAKLESLRLSTDELRVLLPLGVKQYLKNGRGGITAVKRLRLQLDRYRQVQETLPCFLRTKCANEPRWRDDFIRWQQTSDFLLRSLHREYNNGLT